MIIYEIIFSVVFAGACAGLDDDPAGRTLSEDEGFEQPELEAQLQSMVWYHGFDVSEISGATGLTPEHVEAALDRFGIASGNRPERPAGAPLLVLPYPGGRHPRIGFLEGAIDPRADTKVSVVSPWGVPAYVVVDLPEAIWWEDRLLFLAHTHIPTIWTEAGIELEPSPWSIHPDGSLSNQQILPNGVVIDALVVPSPDAVFMELSLTNGSELVLRDLRAQHCVLLRGAEGFDQQSNDNKVIHPPYAACRSVEAGRWIVTAWEPCQRAWANPPCPCLHSDPSFPDCPPGKTVRARGVLAFVNASGAQEAIRSIEALDWRRPIEDRRGRSAP